MVTIRFARTGKKKQAYFRIVAADKRKAVSAKFIEILGNYDPHAKKLTVNAERLDYYLKNGAVPSNTVARLLAKEKIEMPKWVKITEKKKAPKKEVEEKEAPKAPVAEGAETAEGAEAPAETSEQEAEVSTEPAETTEVAEEGEAAPEESKQESEPEKTDESGEASEEKENK